MATLFRAMVLSSLGVHIALTVYDMNETSTLDDRSHVLPTPLALYLNRTATLELMQEANSRFVSNISLTEIKKDNETHQMLLRYRERKRQMRIYNIQQEILQRLGFTRGPNVSAHISAEERESLVQSYLQEVSGNTESTIANETYAQKESC